METVADLLADLRERESVAFSAADRETPMSATEAATTAWQMGNLLRHYGVRPGERVAVVSGPVQPTPEDEPGPLGNSPVPVLAILGALAAGGLVDLDPPGAVDATALVAPAAWLDRYRTGPGTTAIAYGGEADEPDVAHLEREAWSENATPPPIDLDPTTDALAGDRIYAHGDLLALVRRVVVEHDLDGVERLALAAPLTDVDTFLAGVLSPLTIDATVVLGNDDAEVTVGRESTEVTRRIDPARVTGEDT